MSYNEALPVTNLEETEMVGLSKIRDAFDRAVYGLFGYTTDRLGDKNRAAREKLIDYYARHPELEPKPLEYPARIPEGMPFEEVKKARNEAFWDNSFHRAIDRKRRLLRGRVGGCSAPNPAA